MGAQSCSQFAQLSLFALMERPLPDLRCSLSVDTHVRSGDPKGGRENLKTAIHASFTYVATDLDGDPLLARQFVPETEGDKALWDHAEVLKAMREKYRPMPLVSPNPSRQITE